MKKATSNLPFAFGLVGGILAVVQGMCWYACGSCINFWQNSSFTIEGNDFFIILGVAGIIIGVLAIVAACSCKTWNLGLLTILLCCIGEIVLVVLLAKEYEYFDYMNTLSAIFLGLAALIGFTKD